MPKKKSKLLRDSKGRILKGVAQDTNKNGTAGRPCEYCQRKEEILKLSKEYLDTQREANMMVYLKELSMKLGVLNEVVTHWATIEKTPGVLEHPEFSSLLKDLFETQELRLNQRTQGRFNPTGAIFLLKTKHGYIETEKRLLAGADGNAPVKLEIEMVESRVTDD